MKFPFVCSRFPRDSVPRQQGKLERNSIFFTSKLFCRRVGGVGGGGESSGRDEQRIRVMAL